MGLTTSLDVQWDPAETWEINLPHILPYVDVFLPNKIEALQLTGETTITAALNNLSQIGNIIVLKLGEKGSISKHGDSIFEAKPFLNKNVVDADPDANLASILGIPVEQTSLITPISEQRQLIKDKTGANPKQFGQLFKINPTVNDIPDK